MHPFPRWSFVLLLMAFAVPCATVEARASGAGDEMSGSCAASEVVEPAAPGIFGSEVDGHLSEHDLRCLSMVLNEAEPARTARWTLADGALMLVTPGRERGTRGLRSCRDLRATVLEGMETDTAYVTACRVGTGPWGPVS